MTLWTVPHQAPLSMRFSRQEYWSGLLCPPPGDPLTQGSNPYVFVSCTGKHVLPGATWEIHMSLMIPMGKAMAPHSSTLSWKIPWTEEPGRLQSMGLKESDSTERLHFHFSLSCIGEGNGNPLQYFCLENPRDRSLVGCHLWGHRELDMTKAA